VASDARLRRRNGPAGESCYETQPWCPALRSQYPGSADRRGLYPGDRRSSQGLSLYDNEWRLQLRLAIWLHWAVVEGR